MNTKDMGRIKNGDKVAAPSVTGTITRTSFGGVQNPSIAPASGSSKASAVAARVLILCLEIGDSAISPDTTLKMALGAFLYAIIGIRSIGIGSSAVMSDEDCKELLEVIKPFLPVGADGCLTIYSGDSHKLPNGQYVAYVGINMEGLTTLPVYAGKLYKKEREVTASDFPYKKVSLTRLRMLAVAHGNEWQWHAYKDGNGLPAYNLNAPDHSEEQKALWAEEKAIKAAEKTAAIANVAKVLRKK